MIGHPSRTILEQHPSSSYRFRRPRRKITRARASCFTVRVSSGLAMFRAIPNGQTGEDGSKRRSLLQAPWDDIVDFVGRLKAPARLRQADDAVAVHDHEARRLLGAESQAHTITVENREPQLQRR